MSIELPSIEAKRTHHGDGTPVTPASEKKYGYVWVTRAKKSHDWKEIAYVYVAGDVCLRKAQIYFAEHGYVETDYSTGKVLSMSDWRRYKVNQHLKKVGIKN